MVRLNLKQLYKDLAKVTGKSSRFGTETNSSLWDKVKTHAKAAGKRAKKFYNENEDLVHVLGATAATAAAAGVAYKHSDKFRNAVDNARGNAEYALRGKATAKKREFESKIPGSIPPPRKIDNIPCNEMYEIEFHDNNFDMDVCRYRDVKSYHDAIESKFDDKIKHLRKF